MKSKLAAIARGAIRDSETGVASLFHIFEDIKADSFPVVIPEITFFSSLMRDEGDPDEVNGIFKLLLGETVLVTNPVKLSFNGKRRLNVNIRIGGLMIPNPGVLQAQIINADGQPISEYDLTIYASETKPRLEIKPASGSSEEIKSPEHYKEAK